MTEQETRSQVFEEVKIIDCDAHFTEPADLWSSRASAAWKDRVPQHRVVDGNTYWFVDGQPWAAIGGNTVGLGRQKIYGAIVIQPFEEIDPASWNVADRLSLMDDIGIHAQVVYPNGVGFASNHIFALEDLKQREVILKLYNDFYVDIQEESKGRLLPQALLPIWDMDLTVKEMERLLDRGIRGFTLTDRPELLGLPELDNAYFAPMWDLFNESQVPANFHVGAGMRRQDTEAGRVGKFDAETPAEIPAVASPAWSSFGPVRRFVAISAQFFMSNVRIITNLCLSDLFDRYPKLKIVSAESGIGWIPFFLEGLEFEYDHVQASPERSYQKRRPSEYFRDHLYATFWFESFAPAHMISAIGVNNVLVETDIPHPTCYLGAREHFAKVMADLEPNVIRKVLQDNAAKLYKVPLD